METPVSSGKMSQLVQNKQDFLVIWKVKPEFFNLLHEMRSDPKSGTGESNITCKLKLTLTTTAQVKMVWLCGFQAGSRRGTLIFNFHSVWRRSACLLPPPLHVPSSLRAVSTQRKSSENILGSEQPWKKGVLPNTLALPRQGDHPLGSFTSYKASNPANVST